MSPVISRQEELFRVPEPSFDAAFSRLEHISLDATAWLEFVPGWLSGADALFEEVLRTRNWDQRTRWMYDAEVLEPRLTSRWTLDSGQRLTPPLLETVRHALSARYRVHFDSAGFNLYRNGHDSVAWHRDKIRREIADPIVALVSFGAPRRLLFRPLGGGRSRSFALGQGDLLVTGGSCQRTWEHAVPKVARADARISVAFRHGMDVRGYDAR